LPAALPDRPGERTLGVHALLLRPGEALGIALHPHGPVELDGPTTLEVCPATTDGEIDLTGGSWPAASGFGSCVPFAGGHATVPATPVDSFHVGFAVRGRNGAPVNVDGLAITYAGVDQFFLVALPTIPKNGRSATLIVYPRRSSTVVADARTLPDFAVPAGVHVAVGQGDRVLTAGAPDARYDDAHPYAGATAGDVVTISVRGDGPVARLGILMRWA
jgi:hypothetical protein